MHKYKYQKYKTKYYNMLAGQNNLPNTYHINIQNPPTTPWLDWIESGIKKYEGRLNRGIFMKMKVGDIIIFKDNRGKMVRTKIVNLKLYSNFGEAFQDLGEELVPVKNITSDRVKSLYAKYFREKDIATHGVVAIELSIE